jgi:hypothetical protein
MTCQNCCHLAHHFAYQFFILHPKTEPVKTILGFFIYIGTVVETNFEKMIQQYRSDMKSVYQTWFIDNDQRLKAFRTIRNGVIKVIKDIENNTFGNTLKIFVFLHIFFTFIGYYMKRE